MAPAQDSWGTSSGLLDDYDHFWEEVWFGYNDNYQEGKVLLLHVKGPASQDGEVVDEELLTMYSCGDGWQAADGGEKAVHPSGKTMFSNNSNAGKLVDRIIEIGAVDILRDKGQPYEADAWRGLTVHIERQEFSYKDRKTGEERTYEVALPTEVLDSEEDEKPKKRAPKKAAAPKSRSRSRAKDDDEDEDEDETPKPRASRSRKKPLRAEVIAFAAEFDEDDHGSFVEAVYDPKEFKRANEIDDDADLSDEILDPDSELWAEAHEE